ncbi:MAG: peptidyl-dipeptidase Dcp [Candidatus Azotimanducaceae bacterium]|jgi:peptidyl-dipeptidase Dcp
MPKKSVSKNDVSGNPLTSDWQTPYGLPPFDKISHDDYLPAFEQAFQQHLDEIQLIEKNSKPASFENTIEAIDRAGSLLNKVASLFYMLTHSNSDENLQALELILAPKYAAHLNGINTSAVLFARVDTVNNNPPVSLTIEQQQLLQTIYSTFVRSGAKLSKRKRAKVAMIDEELSRLQTGYGQNVLKDANQFELLLGKEDLTGLPESSIIIAANEAQTRGHPDKFLFSISRSSFTPFMEYSDRRDLREKLWRGYTNCANNDNDCDNKQNTVQIASLRKSRANILGYDSHAAYQLDDRMAATPDAVNRLLNQIWGPAKKKAAVERKDLQDKVQSNGGNFSLAPWDWWYYTEEVRRERFDFETEVVKPYFELENVRQGAFNVAKKLFGIRFEKATDTPKYHDDVSTYEVLDEDGSYIGLFLTDYFMRPSKMAGAWMNSLRVQAFIDGVNQTPIVLNTCNFPKGEPTLLGLDEVRTLFHEFGHALHGLLSKVTYQSLSGTAVKKDFVELPSQLMEHWAFEPEVLTSYARHFETGESISEELIAKIGATATFNQGFATSEYLAASYLDLHWHGNLTTEQLATDASEFESAALKKIGLQDEIAPRYRSTYFKHIFSGGYSAGYYAYIWAEVLDADAFEAFKENGIFDKNTADLFRENILEKGGTADPMDLYQKFRGRIPEVEPLLLGRGLITRSN